MFKKFLIMCTSVPVGFDHFLGHGDDADRHRGGGGGADGLLGRLQRLLHHLHHRDSDDPGPHGDKHSLLSCDMM